MKIVIIRHAEPDYENNTLTPIGFEEAKALGNYYSDKDFDYVYCSTMERAMYTAQAVIKKKKIHYEDYLREFWRSFDYKGKKKPIWDFFPRELSSKDFETLSDPKEEFDNKYFKKIHLKEDYDKVIKSFDETLKKHGYSRYKNIYKVDKPNTKTIVFFCHFGMMSVLLSRLMNVSFFMLAHFNICPPSGVTTLISEEKEKGYAVFRMIGYGDVTHLTLKNMKPSQSGRYTETYKESK